MCGRYGFIELTDADGMRYWVRDLGFEDELKIPERITPDWQKVTAPRPEIRPTDPVTALEVQNHKPQLALMRWGFHPQWLRPGDSPIINTRSENLLESRFWRTMMKHRVAIPASVFYEWQAVPGARKKRRWNIRLQEHPFWFAGISSEEDGIRKCTILTQPGCEVMREIHNSGGNAGRQPVMLNNSEVRSWLDPDADPEMLVAQLPARSSNELVTDADPEPDAQAVLF